MSGEGESRSGVQSDALRHLVAGAGAIVHVPPLASLDWTEDGLHTAGYMAQSGLGKCH